MKNETKIKELQEQIRTLRDEGKFKVVYRTLRQGAVRIAKEKGIKDAEKKSKLADLCKQVISEIEGVENQDQE